MANEGKVYFKQQNVRRGVAGYKNLPPNAEVVDDPKAAKEESRSERRARRHAGSDA